MCYNILIRNWSWSVLTELFKFGLIPILSSRMSGLQVIYYYHLIYSYELPLPYVRNLANMKI